jgi:hypothetical protein
MKRVALRLGPGQVFYLKRLLQEGLSGDTFEEVVMTLFLIGLQSRVPAVWMQDWLRELEPKRPSKRARGGLARAAKLTALRRSEIARRAAMARWKKAPSASEDQA